MINISTKLQLRKPTFSDSNAYHTLRNDDLIIRQMGFMSERTSFKASENALHELIKKDNLAEYEYFVIESDNKFAGMIGLSEIGKDQDARLGYWIGQPFRGKGLASTAAHEVIERGFGIHNLGSIYAKVVDFNKASVRVLEKNGFQLDKVEEGIRNIDGSYYDEFLYIKASPNNQNSCSIP